MAFASVVDWTGVGTLRCGNESLKADHFIFLCVLDTSLVPHGSTVQPFNQHRAALPQRFGWDSRIIRRTMQAYPRLAGCT